MDKLKPKVFPANVALLAEGVDRNGQNFAAFAGMHVALLAEGVDRNLQTRWRREDGAVSPSSRRAWIEMRMAVVSCRPAAVALLAEGVDRNTDLCQTKTVSKGSPSSRRAWIEISYG